MTSVDDRLPWEIVETLPSADRDTVDHWDRVLAEAATPHERTRGLVGSALSRYWAVQEGLLDAPLSVSDADRRARTDEAISIARALRDDDLVAETLLGRLYACWGPANLHERDGLIDELLVLLPEVESEELRLRIHEWEVVRHFDRGDLAATERAVARFRQAARDTDLVLFRRREELWRGNLAMLDGRLDQAVRINEDAISSTSGIAGTPFSFQNVAITLAIERYLRRGLDDLIDAIRSIRASSPRVASNWDTGLAFCLAETGQVDEARVMFDAIIDDDLAGVHRDLNWLVTVQLLGLIALRLDHRTGMERTFALLEPFADLDATHGTGYASYGPVGRVIGALAQRMDPADGGRRWFDAVLGTRDPGPWTSLTRLESARGRRSVDPRAAFDEARRAEHELRSYDMAAWADDARTTAIELALDGHGPPIAARSGHRWRLRHANGDVEIDHGVGVSHLVRLLAAPGEEVRTSDLAGSDARREEVSSSLHVLDDEAIRAYRTRLADLDNTPDADPEEIAMLLQQLASARHVASSSVELERVRTRVTKALTRTIAEIEVVDPGLGAHLRAAVGTGRRCIYSPTDGAAWWIVDLDSRSAS